MKKVIARWDDSNFLHGWQYGEYPTEVATCETLGFIVEEDGEKLVLAQTISRYGAQMGITIIPKGCIKSVKTLRIKGGE